MDAIFYSFKKRINSTKRPNIAGINIPVYLKEETSLLSPIFKINRANNINNYNYIYIAELGRYYFITDWTYDGPNAYCQCECDLLATYKNDIGNSTQYIERCSNNVYYNLDLQDTMYPALPLYDVEIQRNTVRTAGFKAAFDEGHVICGIVNQDTNNINGVSYYIFSPPMWKSFCKTLLTLVDSLDIDDISVELQKAIIDPLKYITYCAWYPVTPPAGSPISKISFGPYSEIPATCNKLSAQVGQTKQTMSFNIPPHPQIHRGNWINSSAYRKIKLIFPPFGEIVLDSDAIGNTISLDTKIICDFTTGDAILQIYDTIHPDNIIFQTNSSLSLPIPVTASHIKEG